MLSKYPQSAHDFKSSLNLYILVSQESMHILSGTNFKGQSLELLLHSFLLTSKTKLVPLGQDDSQVSPFLNKHILKAPSGEKTIRVQN